MSAAIFTCDCGRRCPVDKQTLAYIQAGDVTVCTCNNQAATQ